MKNLKTSLFLLPILYTLTSCAHRAPAPEAHSSAVVPSSSGSSSFSSSEKLKEMTAQDSLEQIKKQIEISAFERKNLKVDKKISWKCTAKSGESKFSMKSHNALMAKENAQKACEKKKGAASCYVSECTPNRI